MKRRPPARVTFRVMETRFGPAIVRREPGGCELVWEICTPANVAARLSHHRQVETLRRRLTRAAAR